MKLATVFLIAAGLALVAAQAAQQPPAKATPPAAQPAKEANKPVAAEKVPAKGVEQKAGAGEQRAGGAERGGRMEQLKGETHDAQTPLWKLSDEERRFHPSAPIRGSVLTSTKLMLDAFLAREPGTAMLHFTPRTRIIYHSAVPSGGVYRGWLGLMQFIERCKVAFNLEKFEYSIPFVDEARGFSVIRVKYSGKFVRSGKSLDTTQTIYCKWHFGKLHKCYLVDDDPAAVMTAFFTPAEMVLGKFYEDLFTCGDCAAKHLSDNFQSTVHMFPKSLADKFSYKGVDEFKKRVGSEEAALMLDQIRGIRYLYGSNDTVIVLTKYGSHRSAIPEIIRGRGHRLMGGRSSASALNDLASVSLVKVKDGKIESIRAQLNQPLAPWTVRQLGLIAQEKAAIAHVVKAAKGGKVLGKEGAEKAGSGATTAKEEKPAAREKQKAKETAGGSTAEQQKAKTINK